MIDYDEIIEVLEKKMPEYFKTQLVEEVIYDTPYKDYELYLGKDRALPYHYNLYIKQGNILIEPESKGEEYLVNVLYAIGKYKEYNILPVFFLYAFLRDYSKQGGRIINNVFSLDDLMEKAIKTLNENGYGTVDWRCKRIIPIYRGYTMTEFRFDKFEPEKYNTADKLANCIISLFWDICNTFRMEYQHYPDSEEERAQHQMFESIGKAQEILFRTISKFSIEDFIKDKIFINNNEYGRNDLEKMAADLGYEISSSKFKEGIKLISINDDIYINNICFKSAVIAAENDKIVDIYGTPYKTEPCRFICYKYKKESSFDKQKNNYIFDETHTITFIGDDMVFQWT